MTFSELVKRPSGPVFEPRSPMDTAVIIYTSGTTGTPKGAELTHFQLYMNSDIPGRIFGVEETDIVIVAVPLFHVFGLSSILRYRRALRGNHGAPSSVRLDGSPPIDHEVSRHHL